MSQSSILLFKSGNDENPTDLLVAYQKTPLKISMLLI